MTTHGTRTLLTSHLSGLGIGLGLAAGLALVFEASHPGPLLVVGVFLAAEAYWIERHATD